MRRLARLWLFAAVGALLTILTSWAAAALGQFNDGNLVATYESRNTAPPAWLTPEGWDTRSWHATWGPGIRSDLISEQVWMGSRLALHSDGRRQWTVTHVRVGYPMYAMRWLDYASHLPEEGAGPLRRAWIMGIDIESSMSRMFGPRRVDRRLPIRPISLGFAANTLLYGAFAWGLWSGAQAVRRTVRRRRGLCERCGYPRPVPGADRGPARVRCPECGV